jgi:hypothetical protein
MGTSSEILVRTNNERNGTFHSKTNIFSREIVS